MDALPDAMSDLHWKFEQSEDPECKVMKAWIKKQKLSLSSYMQTIITLYGIPPRRFRSHGSKQNISQLKFFKSFYISGIMTSNSGGHDLKVVLEDKAQSASHDTTSERPNHGQSLEQKISVNSELNLTWIEQIEELEKDGVVITKDKVITSGPGRSSGASEEGPKDPRLIIPRDPSEYPGFPTDMKKFDRAKDFGLAVIMFWAKWRKNKKKINLHVRKEAERASKKAESERIVEKNNRVVGANGRGTESHREESENESQNHDQGWQQQRGRRHSRFGGGGSSGGRRPPSHGFKGRSHYLGKKK
jgi:hypothetical protein